VNETTTKICGLQAKYLKEQITVDSNGCSRMTYSDLLPFLNAIKMGYDTLSETGATASGITSSGSVQDELSGITLEYNTGRKDFVLGRMLEDKVITAEQYKNAVIG
jgi:hypothetical protein